MRNYVWSSYAGYLKRPRKRWPWLRVDRVFGDMGIPQDSVAGRRQFERRMEERRGEEAGGEEWKRIRRGWCLGEAAFRKELLAQMKGQIGEYHGGAERQESAAEQAERLVREELQRRKWREEELERRRKGDTEKAKIAQQLRRETTVTLKWIADRLKMGTWTNVANCLAKAKRK